MSLKVFVSDGESYISRALVKKLRADGHVVVTSSRDDSSVAQVGSAAAVQVALECNVVVLSLVTALNEAEVIIEAVRAQAAEHALVAATLADERKSDEDDGESNDGGTPAYDKTVIAISSTLTWDRSTSMRPPYLESNYRRRRPGTKSASVKVAESHVMALGAPERGLRVHVVAAGLPYGDGEGPLLPLFRRAWLCSDAPSSFNAGAGPVATGLPLPCLRDEDGANLLPSIHVRDLAAFLVNVVVSSPAVQLEAGQAEFLVAVDESRDSLRDIGVAIARNVGCGSIRLVSKADVPRVFAAEDAPLEAAVPPLPNGSIGDVPVEDDSSAASVRAYLGQDPSMSHAMLALLQAHASFDVGSLSMFAHPQLALPDDQWHSRGGLVAHMETVAAEFRQWHDLRPLRIVVLGAPTSGRSHAAGLLSAKYALPIVDVRTALAVVRTGGNLSALSDGTPARDAALAALREAVDKAMSEAEAASAAAAASLAAASSSAKAGSAASSTAIKSSRAKAGGSAAVASVSATPSSAQSDDGVIMGAADRSARIPRALLVRVLRAALLSPVCRNAGWVLDGFPRTWNEADLLFSALPDDDDGITPGPDDSEAKPREEADETALVVSEASSSGVSIVVGDTVVVSPVAVQQEAHDSGDGEGEDGAGEAGELDHSELLARRDLYAGLKPTGSLLLEAPDAWLEARLSTLPSQLAMRGHNSRDALFRRLRFFRVHCHPALTRTPVTWLEAHGRQEVVPIAVDEVWSRAKARASTSAASSGHTGVTDVLAPAAEDERISTASVVQFGASVPSAAAGWGLGAEAVAAAANGSEPLLLPVDLPVATSARASACWGSAVLSLVAPAMERGGRPHNFHPTPPELAALQQLVQRRNMRLSTVSRAMDLEVS
jgi:nucleoside-diphosphate-sugar epimerase